VPGPRKEPQFTTRSDHHAEPAAPCPMAAAQDTPEPSTLWARSDGNRHDAPALGPGLWENSAVWLVLTGIAISASACYLVYAAIVAPIRPPSLTAPAPLTSSPAPPFAPETALPPPEPIPAVPNPAAPPPPVPSPAVERPTPASRPADRPERSRQSMPRRAMKHAPAEVPFVPDTGQPPASASEHPPIDARDLPPPDTPLGPPPDP
jgi:hypothetical protein